MLTARCGNHIGQFLFLSSIASLLAAVSIRLCRLIHIHKSIHLLRSEQNTRIRAYAIIISMSRRPFTAHWMRSAWGSAMWREFDENLLNFLTVYSIYASEWSTAIESAAIARNLSLLTELCRSHKFFFEFQQMKFSCFYTVADGHKVIQWYRQQTSLPPSHPTWFTEPLFHQLHHRNT